MKTKLTLKRETLNELTPADLMKVAGGAITPDCRTVPINRCLGLTETSCECCTASGSC